MKTTKHNITNTAEPIKPGYKKTSVGMIPEDWEVKRIGDLGDVVTGSTPKTTISEYYNGDELFVSPVDIQENTYVNQTEKTLTELGIKQGRLIPKNSILFVCIGSTIGKVSISGKNLITNQQINSVIPNKQTHFYYLFNILKQKAKSIKLLAANQAVPILNKSEFSKIRLPIPPLPEQKAIADCLSTWDKAIEKLSALIAAKKEQKKGLMQGLFSGELKVENGELIQAKEGEDFTKGWKKIELKEILTYEQPTKYLSNNFNDLLNENKVPVLTANKSFVLGYTDENVGIYNKLPVIIFDDFTTASRLVDFSFKVKSSAIKFLQTKSNFNIYFIFERLQLIKIDTTTHKRRWISEFENMVLSIPTIMEQNAFAQFIQTADKEIELLEQKLEAFKIQKKGLMQVLLTGTKRLV